VRICIQTLGTRGDVQPYLALARGLMARGHEVQLAAPEQFADFAGETRVAFAPLPGEILALLDTSEGKAAIAGGAGFSAGFRLLKHARPLIQRLLDAEWQVVKSFSPDLILYHPKSIAAPHIAERLEVPTILASPLPGFTPTSAFPTPMLPVSRLGPLNKISHLLSLHGAEMLFGAMLGKWREESLGLTGRRAGRGPIGTIYAYSPSVLPKPADWDQSVVVSGYWFLDEDTAWDVPEPLSAFLAKGEKPIYVGFGSMPGIDPVALARSIIEGLAQTGQRGLLATGGGALQVTDAPDHIHVISSAPHDRLFRHVAAAFHHGGAGTTGASLRAGLPTIICPFFGDQPFWARRVAELGAGPAPLKRKNLDVDALVTAFNATRSPRMKERATTIGERISAETGVATAVAFIEQSMRSVVLR
jgi:sterol 3beta-glucosyltransferase